MVDAEGIKEIEPHCVGLRAIHSPLTGTYHLYNQIPSKKYFHRNHRLPSC